MWNWNMKDQFKRAASRSSSEDIRTGKVPEGPSRDEKRQQYAGLPVCHLPPNGAECRFRKIKFGEARCSAVRFAKTDCPYLGEVKALDLEVEETLKVEKKMQLQSDEAPPKIDY